MLPKSALFSGFVWMRRDAVSTNCPTVAAKPERNALKGWKTQHQHRVLMSPLGVIFPNASDTFSPALPRATLPGRGGGI